MPIDSSSPGEPDDHATARRRRFLQLAAGSLAPLIAGQAAAQAGAGASAGDASANRIELSPIAASTEVPEKPPTPADPPDRRVGFAVVGIGRLTLNELVPAFARSKHCRITALVSGDRGKATKLARQIGVKDDAIYDYRSFDQVAQNPDVQVVYIVLPNSLHAEFTLRAARAGKHVLCEKPMATSVADCQRMINACREASRLLMIAYRSHYEPMNRAIVAMVKAKTLGTLKGFLSTNSQNMGDPNHWRLKKALAGGGPMPDVGVYCLNAARFLTGEEPNEVIAWTHATPGDERFREVEEDVNFILRFPSGFQATCHSSYSAHRSAMLRLMGSSGWVEMDPAYAYRGLKLRHARVVDGREVVSDIAIPEQDQFALELDHLAQCIRENRRPYSTGEEGMQDQRIIEAIYSSAKAGGKAVALPLPTQVLRGPEPDPVT